METSARMPDVLGSTQPCDGRPLEGSPVHALVQIYRLRAGNRIAPIGKPSLRGRDPLPPASLGLALISFIARSAILVTLLSQPAGPGGRNSSRPPSAIPEPVGG